MKNGKILPLAKPIIRTWSQESLFISTILLKKTAKEWLLDEYLKLYIEGQPYEKRDSVKHNKENNYSEHDDLSVLWSACPFLDIIYMSDELIQNNHQNIIEYIHASIDNGYYLYFTPTNETCNIKCTENDINQIFVCGYDIEKRCIVIVSHYNKKGRPFYREIDNQKFADMYASWNCNTEMIGKAERLIKLLKVNDYEYHSEIKPIEQYVVKYILMVEEEELDSEERIYKKYDIYNQIQTYVDSLLGQKKNTKKDISLFYILCDHTKVLYSKVELMCQLGYCMLFAELIERYRMLFRWSENIINLFLLYWIQEDDKLLISINKILKKMYQEEYSLSTELYDKLC